MTPREKLELLRSYRAAGGTDSYASLLKEAKEYSNGEPKSKLPPLPSYTNIQPTQDNIRMQYTPIDPIQRDVAEVEARKLRVAKREKELQEYYSQPGMVRGMKRKPTPSEVKAHAESSVSYNDKLYNDPVGTLGPDIAMSVIPELMVLKGPQQIISKGLNKLNPFKGSNPWSKVSDIPAPKFISEIDWAKWNPDTPKYPELINEYNAIEESTKKAGTWMKNSDGSPFTGSQLTKEATIAHPKLSNDITNEEIAKMQFLQQQSSWFKKSFQNPVVDDIGNIQINYHGQREGKPFNIFKPSQRGAHGVGNYTFPGNRKAALRYANNNEGRVYELYINSNNPQKRLESVFSPEFNEVTGRLQPGYDFLRVGNEQVTPASNYLKSAIGNVGFFDMTNPNIYKALLPIGLGTGLYNKTTNN